MAICNRVSTHSLKQGWKADDTSTDENMKGLLHAELDDFGNVGRGRKLL